jgi:hypothetical protein
MGKVDRCSRLALQFWHRYKSKSAVSRSNVTRSQTLRQVEASSEVQQHRVDDTILFQERRIWSYVDKKEKGRNMRPSFHILCVSWERFMMMRSKPARAKPHSQ